MRIAALAFALLFAPAALAAEQQWYVMFTGSACKPLARLYHLFPYLEGKTTPEGVQEAMNAKYHDAKLEPFLTVMYRSLRETGEEQSVKDKEFFSHFSRSNAMVVSSKEGQVAIPLATEELCATVHMLPSAASAPAAASAATVAQ